MASTTVAVMATPLASWGVDDGYRSLQYVCPPTLVQKGKHLLPLAVVLLNNRIHGSHWQELYDILNSHGKCSKEM